MGVVLAVLGLAAACFCFRLARGPALADRVVALDGLLVVGANAIAVDAVRTGSVVYLPVLVVLALVGFVSTAVVSRVVGGQS